MDIIIYGIYDPTNNNVLKYIGKTTLNPNKRLSNHIYRAKSGRSKSLLSKWILQLCDIGYKPIIKTIFIYKNGENWQECERKWISKSLHEGAKLLNQTAGGNGSHIRSYLDEETYKMLGKIPDEQIAKSIGVSRKCISYHRNKAKISPAPKKSRKYNPHTKGKPSPRRIKFSQEIKNLIGIMPDTKIAKIANVHAKTILRFRKRNKIKAFILNGENHGAAKLTNEEIKDIRNIHKTNDKSIKYLSEKFNVSYHTIWDIINNRSWKEIIND